MEFIFWIKNGGLEAFPTAIFFFIQLLSNTLSHFNISEATTTSPIYLRDSMLIDRIK